MIGSEWAWLPQWHTLPGYVLACRDDTTQFNTNIENIKSVEGFVLTRLNISVSRDPVRPCRSQPTVRWQSGAQRTQVVTGSSSVSPQSQSSSRPRHTSHLSRSWRMKTVMKLSWAGVTLRWARPTTPAAPSPCRTPPRSAACQTRASRQTWRWSRWGGPSTRQPASMWTWPTKTGSASGLMGDPSVPSSTMIMIISSLSPKFRRTKTLWWLQGRRKSH